MLRFLRRAMFIAALGALLPGRALGDAPQADSGLLAWPAVTKECRPWTYWWWLGSAVDERELTRNLQMYHQAGLGGLHIIPIYGATGCEDRYIPYLSPKWMQMLAHTVREAARLGMGVDMTPGTGWPFGGPWVTVERAAAKVFFETWRVDPQHAPAGPIQAKADPRSKMTLKALVAFGPNDQWLDLTQRVEPAGKLDWRAPAGTWDLHAVFQGQTHMQVKRAAPGGEGNVMDYFSRVALDQYLAPFDRAFAESKAPTVRAFYNDSYESAAANWTADLFEQFQRRRGYDLRRHVPALRGEGDQELVGRVRSDYRETLSDLMLDEFTRPWVEWSHRHGALTRNQAHGSPANWLDLYAAADIPETEVFGTAWLDLVGLEPLPGTPPRHGAPGDVLACKMASSAAHVAGKPLAASESCTWLGEHFKVPPEHVKSELDLLWVMGINHVFFHGLPFSPEGVPWPGWQFYASTYFGPANPWWQDFAALNAYIARCQSFLQGGRSDNDVLVYFPIFDLWAQDTDPKDSLQQHLNMHSTQSWLHGKLGGFAQAGRLLWERGYGFDFVSDRLLTEAVEVEQGALAARGNTYRALVIAGCGLMPETTLRRLLELVQQGATVLIVGQLPKDVPGLSDLEKRRAEFRRWLADVTPSRTSDDAAAEVRTGKGRLLGGTDLEKLLAAAGVHRETVVDRGVRFVRRVHGEGHTYFLVNFGSRPVEGWVELAVPAGAAALFDPASGRSGLAAVRVNQAGRTEVRLQLEPGESLVVRTGPRPATGPAWPYFVPAAPAEPIEGPWEVEFVRGGPRLPRPARVQKLASWTQWPEDSEDLRAFSGTARYSIAFRRPAVAADAWRLELGQVCHSARVRLNGVEQAVVYARPWRDL